MKMATIVGGLLLMIGVNMLLYYYGEPRTVWFVETFFGKH